MGGTGARSKGKERTCVGGTARYHGKGTDLDGGADDGDVCESQDVREEERDGLVGLRDDGKAQLELVSHRPAHSI